MVTLSNLKTIQFYFFSEYFEKVTAYKNQGVKVMIALGGWNDSKFDKYSRLVNDPVARATFTEKVIEFIEEHNFDGLDLDWEYPRCWQVQYFQLLQNYFRYAPRKYESLELDRG